MGSQPFDGLPPPPLRTRAAALPASVAPPLGAVSAIDRIRQMYREVVLMDFFERLENGGVEKLHEKLGSQVVWNGGNSIRIP